MSGAARLAVVGALLVSGVAVGQLTGGPAADTVAAHDARVVGATAVCPDVRRDGDRGASTVTAGVPGSPQLPALASGPLAGPAVALPAGQAVVRDLAGEAAVTVVTATGDGAGALTAEQTTRATGGPRRGVAALSCPEPATRGWFVGGATVVGSSAELLLVNLEEVAALVDVRVWTADGPADPRPGRGLVVPPRGRLAVPLDRLAPDRDLLALHVAATRGRVASALRSTTVDGRTPLGTDWVPQSAPPAREVVVPGVPAGPGRRTAVVVNPGTQAAVVSLELTTDDGQLVPEGLGAVAVPAGTSVPVDLTDHVAGTPAAVRVRSDGAPVLAGVVVADRQDGPVRDIAYAAGGSALSSSALLADVRLSPPTEVTLLLSALDGDAVVELLPSAGEPERVEVPAATTVAVRLSRFLPPRSTGSVAVEVRVVSGSVHAARYSRERGARGPFTTLLPVQPPRLTAPAPVVVADPGAGR